MKKLLEKLVTITYQRCIDDGYDPLVIENLSHRHLSDYQEKRYVALTCREALEQPDYLWVKFFSDLYNFVGGEVRPLSPVSNRTDSSWMDDYDYCFVNPRATSLDSAKTGTFLQAIKLLPILRCKGIHLAPFFDCTFGNVYCIDSLRMVNPATLDGGLLKAGIGPNEQVRFFIDMAHLCGMVVGFDLEPHTSQFSRVVLEHPDKFRWLRLNQVKTDTLPSGMEAVLHEQEQQKIIEAVQKIVQEILKTFALEAVEPCSVDGTVLADKSDRIRDAHSAVVKELINQGLWTIPSHTWNGVGLPRFKRYNRAGNYPEFEYLDSASEDQSEHAFGMVTPFRFYDGLPVNKASAQDSAPSLNQDVIDFFAGIVPEIQKRYGFDFVRFDYVDHVFDSVIEIEGEQELPVSDRYTSTILQTVISCSRESIPYLGAMAERMGSDEQDIRSYSSSGFDLLVGDDWLGAVDAAALGRLCRLSQASVLAAKPRQLCAAMWAIDTHDSGHPLFWIKPLSEAVGSEGMLLRQFIARFATLGRIARPMYECMGNQDMSSGLYTANNHNISLTWVGNRNHCRLYHAIEDSYERFCRKFLREGTVVWWFVKLDWAAWAIDAADDSNETKERLICVVALERLAKQLLLPSIDLDVGRGCEWSPTEVHEVLLDGSGLNSPLPLIDKRLIKTGSLLPRAYRLFLVHGNR